MVVEEEAYTVEAWLEEVAPVEIHLQSFHHLQCEVNWKLEVEANREKKQQLQVGSSA